MSQDLQKQIPTLIKQLDAADINASLKLLAEQFPGTVTFSSSFSFEDQVITHAIAENALPISIFTLDTGRMFQETYSTWSKTNDRYSTKIKAYYPEHTSLETYIN